MDIVCWYLGEAIATALFLIFIIFHEENRPFVYIKNLLKDFIRESWGLIGIALIVSLVFALCITLAM